MQNCNYIVISVIIAIIADFFTGFIAALKNKSFKSSIMREGLFHKIGEALTLTFAVAVDYMSPMWGVVLPFKLLNVVGGYLIVMELGSIIENIRQLSPESGDILDKVKNKLTNSAEISTEETTKGEHEK